MRLETFWHTVDSCRPESGALADFNAILKQRLETFTASELADFHLKWLAASDGIYSWELWDASALMLGGTDDDSFMDFRSWVISLGSGDYGSVLSDADNLVDFAEKITDAESPDAQVLGQMTTALYYRRTGQSPPNPPDDLVLVEPMGRRTDLSNIEAIKSRFPRIYALRSRIS